MDPATSRRDSGCRFSDRNGRSQGGQSETEVPTGPRDRRRERRADLGRDRIDQPCLPGLAWTCPIRTNEQVAADRDDRSAEVEGW